MASWCGASRKARRRRPPDSPPATSWCRPTVASSHSPDDLWAVLDGLDGDVVTLGIVRGVEDLSIEVTLPRPADDEAEPS